MIDSSKLANLRLSRLLSFLLAKALGCCHGKSQALTAMNMPAMIIATPIKY